MSKVSTESTVLKYLTDQNRPYSVNDILQNLHKEHGKAAIQKALDTLVQNGSIREKTYGKQKVYFFDQSKLPDISEAESKVLNDKLVELEKLYKEYQDEVKQSQAELKIITNSLTTEDARNIVAQLEKETSHLSEKYQQLSAAQGSEVLSKEERNKIRLRREIAIKEWKLRKRMCMNMINAILEGCEMSKPALLEEMAVETDEDCGVEIPD